MVLKILQIFTMRLDEETVQAIKRHPKYVEPAPGRQGGVGAWLRWLARRELGLGPRPDPHEEQARRFAEIEPPAGPA